MPVTSGEYTIRELDLPGYTSSTPNTVSAHVNSGDAVVVNFGDVTGAPIGFIRGKVFEDDDMDGIISPSDKRIPDVMLSLDTGELTHTNTDGEFEFIVPVGSYVVVETDLEGYSSTTANSADADIFAPGDTVTVNFGDTAQLLAGTLEGYVFEDDDQDGVRDAKEGGLSNVTLVVSSGDSTVTNATGYYSFSLKAGFYSIKERDEPGYTSSTVNTFVNILIVPDTTVVRNFGDFLINQNDYIEIVIGNTERALSVAGADVREDTKNDLDIILGTPFTGGLGNLLVFQNTRQNANTALGALFSSTPTYKRNAGHNINTLTTSDFSGDGLVDVFTGVSYNTGNNMQLWYDDKNGDLAITPDISYVSSANTFVLASELADISGDGHDDLIVGLKTSTGFTGGFEVFRRLGSGSYVSNQYVNRAGESEPVPLGEVWTVSTGDVDNDGDIDVVVGSRTSDYYGFIDVYLNEEAGKLAWDSRYVGMGAPHAIEVIDMKEDDMGDADLVVGSSSAAYSGWLTLWHNTEGKFGTPDETGFLFPPEVMHRFPNDANSPGGEVLSLAVALVNPDIFPDIFIGTKNSAFYSGDVFFLETFGMLPSQGRQLNSTAHIGEVVTMNIGDFNNDNGKDVVVGTRTSTTQGKLLIYFYDD